MRFIAPIALGLVAWVLLASCSSGGQSPFPSATTTVGTSITTAGSSPSSDGASTAPKVSSPLEASKFVANPCASLTTVQLANIALANAEASPSTAAGNPLCAWDDNTTEDGIGITWMSQVSNGLSSVYSQRAGLGYFIPTNVDSYPAAYWDFSDLRSQGTCSLSVGVSDELYFIAKFDSESAATKTQACSFAEQAASDVIKNLGGS